MTSVLLFLWIVLNVFISIYELYIIAIRKNLTPTCKSNFWSTPIDPNSNFFKAAWEEYACKVDNRYFDPVNFVFCFEFLNVIFTFVLVYLLLNKNWSHIRTVLLLQFVNAVCYFVTIDNLGVQNGKNSHHAGLKIMYKSISALWLVVPALLLLLL